jgi:hypothetical protein
MTSTSPVAMAAFAETVSGYDSHTEASENSSVGTDVDEGIDPREELYLNESRKMGHRP